MKRMLGYREPCPFEPLTGDKPCPGTDFQPNRLAAWSAYRKHMLTEHAISVGGMDDLIDSKTEDITWSPFEVARGSALMIDLLREQIRREREPGWTPPDMPADLYNELMPHLLYDGTRDGILLADKVRALYGASARRNAQRSTDGVRPHKPRTAEEAEQERAMNLAASEPFNADSEVGRSIF